VPHPQSAVTPAAAQAGAAAPPQTAPQPGAPTAQAPAQPATPPAAQAPAAEQQPPAWPGTPSGPPAGGQPSTTAAWPPPPQTEEQRQEEQLPELPFTRDIWGKPAVPPSREGTVQLTTFDLPPQGTPEAPFKQQPAPSQQPPGEAGKSKRAVLATLGVLVLAGVATGGFFAYRSLNAPPPATTTAAATESQSAQPPAQPSGASPPDSAAPTVPAAAVLDSEETDPKKMSMAEAFRDRRVEAAGADFTRVRTHNEATCTEAASGVFAEALSKEKCSRVLRATYVDAKRRYAVTSGIAVFPSKEAAIRADRAKDLSRNVWFRPLPGPSGSGGDRVHIAGGYAAGLVWGRYIVFSYATYADGHTPAAKDKTLGKVSDAFRDEMSLVLERRISGD
jgi:hypothetical protein